MRESSVFSCPPLIPVLFRVFLVRESSVSGGYVISYTSGGKQIHSQVLPVSKYFLPQLGTRQDCRDNVTMFASQKKVNYCIMSIFVATPFSTEAFFKFFHVTEVLQYYVIVLSLPRSLTKCSVASAVFYHNFHLVNIS